MSILDEPMFPQMTAPCPACNVRLALPPGKSARVYAAIHLCVPMSGDEELDAMIRKAQRERLAGMAMEALIAGLGRHVDLPGTDESHSYACGAETIGEEVARQACGYADAMIAEREKKP